MNKIFFIALFFTCLAGSAQKYPHTNDQEAVRPMVERFIAEAELRGIEVTERLSRIDSIMIIGQPIFSDGSACDGVTWERGSRKRIELKAATMENKGCALRLFFHEMGHAFGLEHCCSCTYNIMRCQTNERANYLFKDDRLAEIFFDEYFEAIRNPKKYNDGHTHY